MNPFPGCAGTYSIGTDKHPCTVLRIENDGARLGVRLDRVYGTGVFSPYPLDTEPDRWFTRGDDGLFRLEGRSFGQLELGARAYHKDPKFGPDDRDLPFTRTPRP